MEDFIGIIKMFAGTFAPQGWEFCDGRLLSIAQYTALFSLLGTTYGGNGVTNFALPDLRGRVPVGTGQGPQLTYITLGETGGIQFNTLTSQQIPAQVVVVNNDPNADSAINVLAPSGANHPHLNMPPYLGINFIICVSGLYPARP
ncbi:MAG: phage tail protein [Chitinophagales bacterium]|jgi:microcystin-dependent protein|nr:phage tail protein [Chitinophagales bacterium]